MIEAPVAKLTPNEAIKEAHPTLAGSILQTLRDAALDRFSEEDVQLLKAHGIYQQDDRDLRKLGKKYIFMVRARIPGGIVPAPQYLVFDRLARECGDGTLRITSRQGFQFHGVIKGGLARLIKDINGALATTLAACGDNSRNVMAPPTPSTSRFTEQVQADARRLAAALSPRTPAYHQIWIEGVEVKPEESAAQDFVDPLYGRTYLPRKFKAAFVIPPLNDIDILTNCLGFIAIVENGALAGYNLSAGGGMGLSHGNKATFPRLADVIGFFRPEQVVAVGQAVLKIHRDFGDRTNRRHARLKYVLEDRGVDWFRQEVERRVGFPLEAARPFTFTRQGDLFGWHRQFDGNYFLGLYVETGRIKDTASCRLKSALSEVLTRYPAEVRLTPAQNLILAGVPGADREAITAVLEGHGVEVERQATVVRRASMACPALPTCGLALAESERVLPDLLTRLEGLLAELGLGEQEIVVRMTGCPNGCARPYMAEIGFVGRAPNKYQIYLGGNEAGTRLNRLYKDAVKNEDLVNELRPVLARYAQERAPDERFGDWCERVLGKERPTSVPE